MTRTRLVGQLRVRVRVRIMVRVMGMVRGRVRVRRGGDLFPHTHACMAGFRACALMRVGGT